MLRPGPAGSEIDERLWAVMKHPFLATAAGACSESFFQAAKMELEADARFIMFDLDAMGAAKYTTASISPLFHHLCIPAACFRQRHRSWDPARDVC